MNDTLFLEWWHWEIAGIALVLLELALPSFFIIWFGLGAMLTGFVLLAVPDLVLSRQIAAWIEGAGIKGAGK